MVADPPPVGGSSFRVWGSTELEEDDNAPWTVTSTPDPTVHGVDDCTAMKTCVGLYYVQRYIKKFMAY